MRDLISKAVAISAVIFCLMWTLVEIFPMGYLIKVALRALALTTGVLYLMARMKNGFWISISWLWSAFFLPVFSIEILMIGYLYQFVSVEIIMAWGVPVFLGMLPLIIWIMMKHFRSVILEM